MSVLYSYVQKTLTDHEISSPVNHTNESWPDDPKTVTFVGRPFPLSEAHDHFSRLRRWGMTFSR